MSLVRLENVSKSFAGADVLESVNLRIEAGEKIGLIGRNGTGKSTIFRLITDEMPADKGTIERMKRVRFACLAQLHKTDPTATLHGIVLDYFGELIGQERELQRLEECMAAGDESVLDAYSDLQDAFSIRGGYEFRTRVKQVLQGLGFTPDEFDMPFEALSGGQRTRLMLALVLLEDADLLLLDEPENHLDLEAREWLESYLRDCKAGVVVISHDRRTLNAVPDRILELERGEVRTHAGNYEAYVKSKALLREQQQAAYDRQQEFIRKEEVWIDRFRYKATKAKQAQSRQKQLDKLERVLPPASDADTATFNLGEIARSGAVVLDAKGLTKRYDGLTLYENVSFQVNRGERVGIIGPNGAGKTTLLKQVAGLIEGESGEVLLGNKVTMATYDQNHEGLNPAADILTEVNAVRPLWKPEQIRTFLGKMLFRGDDVFKTISTLSGGELARVSMSRLILGGANVLLLDEPTNHLDLVSREALESALLAFPGTLLLVSHDRALIDQLVDKLIVVEGGRAEVHLGNYSDYLWKKRNQSGDATARAKEQSKAKEEKDVLRIRRENGKKEPDKREDRKARQREDRKRARRREELELEIETTESRLSVYDGEFTRIDPSDYTTLQTMQEEYQGMKKELENLYAEWESLAEA